MPKNNRKLKSNAGNSRRGQRSTQRSPPQFDPQVILRHKFRYVADFYGQSTSPDALTSTKFIVTSDLLLTSLVAANVGTSDEVLGIFSSVRVRRVSMWQAAQGIILGGATEGGPTTPFPSTIAVTWFSTSTPPKVVSDTVLGSADIAHVSTTPPPNSLARFWSNGSTNLFELDYSLGVVVDIELDLLIGTGEAGTYYTAASNVPAGLWATPLNAPSATLHLTPVYLDEV